MPQDEVPDFVKYGLAVVVPTLFALFFVVSFTFHIRPIFTAEKVYGIKFRFLPLQRLWFRPSWAKGFNRTDIQDFIDSYIKVMPQAYALLGIKVTELMILSHIATIKVAFKLGFLKSDSRTKLGLNDLDGDGVADKLTGLTHGPELIEVAVLENRLEDGKMDVKKTALFYEIHNALIWKFAGYEVAIGEAFVPPDEEALLPFLGGKSLKEMKKKRQVLDAAFGQIK